ncbi:hypothetical protein GCM10010156_51960 [Planobispora rosea]|uniref:Uncharacterized protein n=1 Tax=Planobispora rosea TaxID=35762 RepID=A0A8J3WET4_PLARO|nr:hypothetical protein [Planobispora rosea]GGS87097.1 hypothetical protein GCM10010156_51960 [Planobispora rosea]GIH86598.1 hypothetical protein Pro02_50060 [Planobispora rosea]
MTDIHTGIHAQDLAGRYVALWNEPDAELRRKAIEDLWAEGGSHVLHPPQEIRETAARLGFDSPTLAPPRSRRARSRTS